jgi:hypothetical protein
MQALLKQGFKIGLGGGQTKWAGGHGCEGIEEINNLGWTNDVGGRSWL